LNNQHGIVGYLDDMLNKYSVIEKEMHKAIELLQERRTALISSAVTGKIDVHNWQHSNEVKTELSL
jgi:type I restriction enzyme S subunit